MEKLIELDIQGLQVWSCVLRLDQFDPTEIVLSYCVDEKFLFGINCYAFFDQ